MTHVSTTCKNLTLTRETISTCEWQNQAILVDMTLMIAFKDYIIDWTNSKMLTFSSHTKTCQLYRTHVENILFSLQLITCQCFGMHVLVSYPETQDILCHRGVHSSLLGESRECDPSLGPPVLALFAIWKYSAPRQLFNSSENDSDGLTTQVHWKP